MKTTGLINFHAITYFILLSICFDCYSQSNGSEYYTDFDLALKVAKENSKDVFAYVGYGNNLVENNIDSLLITNELSQFITKRFVRLRVKGTRPMFIFYDIEGRELYRVEALQRLNSNEAIMTIGDFALTRPFLKLKVFKKAFKRKKTNISYLKNYLHLAKSLGDQKLIDNILKQYADIYENETKGEWLDFVFENTYDEDSKLFGILIKHKEVFEEKFGKEEVQTKILAILVKELSVFFDRITLDKFIRKLIKKINNYDIIVQDEYLMSVVAHRKYSRKRWNYNIKNDNGKFATKILNSYSEWLGDDSMMGALIEVAFYIDNEDQLEKSLKQLDSMLEKHENFWLLDIKSVFLYKLGRKDESLRFAIRAQEGANELNYTHESALDYMRRKGILK